MAGFGRVCAVRSQQWAGSGPTGEDPLSVSGTTFLADNDVAFPQVLVKMEDGADVDMDGVLKEVLPDELEGCHVWVLSKDDA